MAAVTTHGIPRTLLALTIGCFTLFSSVATAFAGPAQLDTGVQLSAEQPYQDTQVIENIFDNPVVYGKLLGDTPVDIYKFVPGQDGEQTIMLLGRKNEVSSVGLPFLILLDPTDATEARELGLPVPAENYHTAILKQEEGERSFTEPALLDSFMVFAEQRVRLQKDTEYYLVVLDPGRQAVHYAIKFGDGKAWGAGQVISQFGTWFKVKTDAYAGGGPYGTFPAPAVGLLLFFIGLSVLIGTWVIQEVFSFGANRSKAAGYLLVKLQPFSRVITWISFWFAALGGYMYFSRGPLSGIPFVLLLIAIPLVINQLVLTLVLSPQISRLEVSHREAVVPLKLRRALFVTFLINLIGFISFLGFVSLFFV